MATINASSSADIIVPSNNGTTYRGLGGDDTYIISNAIAANAKVTIVDTSGADTIQLVDGLSITSSKFAADSAQLTLSNGAVIQINGADKFTYEVGGNETAGVTGTSVTFAGLASNMGVATLPTGSTISDGSSGTVSGTAISSGSIGYSLSAGATSVAEGSSITYTVTASSAPASDVTLTYNVTGDTNGSTVDAATSADLVALSGTFTMKAGETTTTFNVTPNVDDTNEGLEGIKVSVFDASLASIGSATALISNLASTAASTTNLTTGVDSVAAGDGSNIIGGTVQAAGAAGSTAQPGDVVDGGAGEDTFKLSLAGTLTGAHTISGIEMSGVETIEINGFQTADAQDYTLDMSLITGVTTLGLTSSSASNDITISNVPSIVELNATSGGGDLTVTYKAAAVAGTNAQTINVSDYTGTISVASVENVTINSGAIKSTIADLQTDKQTSLTITGDTALTITATLDTLTNTVDASTTTAGVSLQVVSAGATAPVTITGGSGNDTVNLNTSFSKYITYNGGEGTDTLAIDDADDISSTSTVGLTSVESLRIDTNDDTSFNMSFLPTITSVVANAANGGNAVTLTKMTAENSNVTITETGTEGVTGTLAIDGSADVLNLTLGTGLGNGSTHTLISMIDHETVNLTVAASLDAATYTITDMDATDMTTLNVSGPGKVTFTSLDLATMLSTIDASGMTGTGALIMGENPGNLVAQTITGSGGNDTLYAGTKADTVDGGAGVDTIYGGAGNDIISGGAGNDIIFAQGGIDNVDGGAGKDTIHVDVVANFEALATPEVVDGGAGTDTLNFGAAVGYTLDATDMHNIKNIEVITADTSGAFTLALDDVFFTSNGSTSIIIKDAEATANATVTAAAVLDANNSIAVTSAGKAGTADSFTGGAGADTFTFNTTLDADVIDGSDVIAGGKGSDTLIVNVLTIAGNITITTAVASIENYTFNSADTLALTFTLADSGVVTSALQANTGIIDATGMTGSGALTFSGDAENDSDLHITGGRAGDTLTGGNATASAATGAALFDTIYGGDGADIIDGGAGIDKLYGQGGNDTISVSDDADFVGLTAAETVDGGTGTDTLAFVEDATLAVAAADLAGMKDIEVIKFEGNNTVSLTLSDSIFTSNGNASLTVWDEEGSQPLTLKAGGLGAANSIKVKINTTTGDADATESLTLGGGNDTVTYHSAQRLDDADVIAFGGGTDALVVYINNTALSATLTNVSSVESITLVQVTTATATITLADGNFVSTQAGVIDASATAGVLTFDGSPEDDSSLTIKGGTGNDIITGTDAKLSGATVLGDTITGGNGTDTIEGSLGADIITGGAGADTFKYSVVADSAGSYVDTLVDFADGTDLLDVTIDRSGVTTAQNISLQTTAGQASKSAAQDALTGQPGQAVYVTDTGHLYINANADNLLTSLDYKIKINPAGTAASTLDATNDDNINYTLTTGSAVDTISLSGGVDIITSGAGADIITTSADGKTDTFNYGANEFAATAVANGGTAVDIITGFVVAEDVLSLSLAAVETGSTDWVNLDDFASVAAGDTPLIALEAVAGTFDMATITDNTNVLAIGSVGLGEGAIETALEANGDRELTANGTWAVNDGFLVLSDDGTDSGLFLVVCLSGGVANDSAPAANELAVMKLIALPGIAASENIVAADFAIVA
jgi:Ca2+-binding RTX toxin-like protein